MHEHADAPHPRALLRARAERPRRRRTAEKREESAALAWHMRAVCALMTSSNLFAFTTGTTERPDDPSHTAPVRG
jgi:hypothetical protein